MKSISKQAAELGGVKIIVKIDSQQEITEAMKNKLDIVAAIVSNAFIPKRLREETEIIKQEETEN